MNRKEAIRLLSAGVAGMTWPGSAWAGHTRPSQRAGHINHSACRWCYQDLTLEELCQAALDLGLSGIDLLKPSEIDIVRGYGLQVTMLNPETFSLTEGFNDPSLHPDLQQTYSELIDLAAKYGIRNVICFSGNRRGISDEEGMSNCEEGLIPLVQRAQSKGVVIHMELLNSKVDHPDYQCDHTDWGVSLCKRLDNPHFRLLYDIYHMQIMEGDLIATIRKNHAYFGHYHTGGVPGRHEIDDTQEIHYPAVMQAIVETGFDGFVAQEFIPTRENPIHSLAQAIRICDV